MKARQIFLPSLIAIAWSDPSWAATAACRPSAQLGMSVEHVGPPGVPGSLLDVAFYDDGSAGVGIMQVTADPSDSVMVRLTADGARLKTYDVQIPCSGSSLKGTGNTPWTMACANGYVLAKSAKKPWVGSLKVSWDDDDDVLLAKLIDHSTLNGNLTLCGELWNILGSAPSQATACFIDADCTNTAQPVASDTKCVASPLYGGQGGYCGDPPPAGSVAACDGSENGFPWTWTINGTGATQKACASVDGVAASCVICSYQAGTDTGGPQCPVTVNDSVSGLTWVIGYDPANGFVYVEAGNAPAPGSAFQPSYVWNPTCSWQ